MTNLISVIHAWVTTRTTDDRGATMAEYGLMLALVAVIAAVGAGTLGGNINSLFNDIATKIWP